MDLGTLAALALLFAGVVAVAAPVVPGGAVSLLGVLVAAFAIDFPFGPVGVAAAAAVAVAAAYAEREAGSVGTRPTLDRELLGFTAAFAFLATLATGPAGAVLAVAAVAAAAAYRDAARPRDGIDAALDALAGTAAPLALTGTLFLAVQLAA